MPPPSYKTAGLSQGIFPDCGEKGQQKDRHVIDERARPRDRPSSIGLALHPYLLNTKDSGVFLVGCCT